MVAGIHVPAFASCQEDKGSNSSKELQIWGLVLVSVTSLRAQNTGGQPKQKLHFCPSTWENHLTGRGEGAGLKSGRVAGVLVCSIWNQVEKVLSCMWLWLNTELEATNATDADNGVCWCKCCSYGLKQDIFDFNYWHEKEHFFLQVCLIFLTLLLFG